jgi:uncharacterized protein
MGRGPAIILFVAGVLAVLVGLHYYLWRRLIRDTELPRPWRAIATIALFAAALSLVASLFLARVSFPLKGLLVWPGFTWIGGMFLLFVGLLAADLVRLGASLSRRILRTPRANPGRRAFFARLIAGGTVGTVGVVGGGAIRSALGSVEVRRVEVPLRRVGATLDGLTLVQLTDLHVGPTIGRADMAALVETTNALSPDIVAITGDLVDGTVAQLRDSVAPLGDLRARYGVFFVTGNHEYFSGATAWIAEIGRLGIRVLRNERVTIGEGPSAFYLAGVDDRSAARYPDGHGEDLETALSGRDPARPVILLAHQPRTVLDAASFGVDLQISGHTHGGQIWPFGALVRLQQRFLAGLGRHKDTMIYVSRGTGYWGPPMRLLAPAEITQIVLRGIPDTKSAA